MSTQDEFLIRLVISKRQLKLLLAAALVLGLSYALRADTLTLTTYYPAPSGVYKKLVTTLDAALARDGGKATIGPGSAPADAKLFIGGKAVIAGAVQLNDGTAAAGRVLTASDASGNARWSAPYSVYAP